MKFFWKSYSILFLSITTGNIIYFFSNSSVVQLYYTAMMSFFTSYLIIYELNVLNLVLTLLSAIFIILYAFNRRWEIRLAQIVFFLRLLTEFCGHTYEIKFIKSAFGSSTRFGLITLFTIAIPLIPSYIAHYRYAFKPSK